MSPAKRARGLAAALIGLLAALPLTAGAQVHKCTQPDGTISFQAAPCGADTPAPEPVTAAQLNAAQRAQDRARARAASAALAAGTDARGHPAGPRKAAVAACRKAAASTARPARPASCR